MRQWLVRLYPRAWRHRYEDEFLALLEQQPLTYWDSLDIIRGALDSHWSARISARKERNMTDRVLRIRSILSLAIGVVLGFRSFMRTDAVGFGLDLVGVAGLACLVLGLVLAYRLRQHINVLS